MEFVDRILAVDSRRPLRRSLSEVSFVLRRESFIPSLFRSEGQATYSQPSLTCIPERERGKCNVPSPTRLKSNSPFPLYKSVPQPLFGDTPLQYSSSNAYPSILPQSSNCRHRPEPESLLSGQPPSYRLFEKIFRRRNSIS
jgi:hypothetical protein